MQEECKGGFLFISHSHKDMDKVRQLRNKLEDAGYEPLCFYLKALDSGGKELDNLIKREIDARQWFVYAVTDNARESDWVQRERNWRKRPDSKNKQEWKVDLESDLSIDEISEILIKGLSVNIIYCLKDSDFVNVLRSKLKEKDFQITEDIGELTGVEWSEIKRDNIKKASEYGTNIIILSKNSIHSQHILYSVQYARYCDSLMIPVYIDDVKLEDSLIIYLAGKEGIFFYENQIKDEKDLDNFVNVVVDEISDIIDKKFN